MSWGSDILSSLKKSGSGGTTIGLGGGWLSFGGDKRVGSEVGFNLLGGIPTGPKYQAPDEDWEDTSKGFGISYKFPDADTDAEINFSSEESGEERSELFGVHKSFRGRGR